MILDETVTYLEMTSADQLVPGRPAPTPIELRLLGPSDLPLLRDTYIRVGTPHVWHNRPLWSQQEWERWAGKPTLRPWTVWSDERIIGLVEMDSQPDGDVEIHVFGLVPEFVGRGYGGHALTIGVTQAWREPDADGAPARRVWLHTSTLDHPHALTNYRRRGFRVFHTERKRREIPPEYVERFGPPPLSTS